LKPRSGLRVAMIGCGEIAYSATAKALKSARNAELALVMDVDPELAASLGQSFNVPYTSDLEEVLANPDIDAVLISTPHVDHELLTVRAAEAGKHVMCEKPIACTLEQADQMIQVCERAGVRLGINMVSRYEAVTRAAKRLIASGAIGRIIGLQVHFMIHKPESYWDGGFTGRSKSAWRRFQLSAGGGVLMINMVHELDRLRFISGLDIVSASAESGTLSSQVEVEDYAVVNYRFSNGALGTVTASSCAHGDRCHGVQIIGTHGQVTFDIIAASLLRQTVRRKGRSYYLRRMVPDRLLAPFLRRSMQVYTTKDVQGLKRNRWQTIRVPAGTNPRQIYIEKFADAVLTGGQPEITGEEGRQVLQAVLAAYGSARTGRRWMIPSTGELGARAMAVMGPAVQIDPGVMPNMVVEPTPPVPVASQACFHTAHR
jgi:UDP-N-acetyl-2-amino-2-deoxyglucuronate dehydrogenase